MLIAFLAPLLLSACGQAAALDPQDVERCYAEAVQALDRGAGIRLPRPVEVVVLTSEEASDRRAAYARELGDEASMTATMDIIADLAFSEGMLGRYLPDEQVVYILEDVLAREARASRRSVRDVLFPVMAHELVHAYDDQVYGVLPVPADIADYLADPSQLPELQALMGLIEGRATYASELACAEAGRRPLPAHTVESARDVAIVRGDGSVTGDVLAGMANSVVRLKILQYAQGRAFAEAAHRFGGEPFFRHVFDSLPLELEELEDFERFKLRWAEALEAQEAEAGG